MAIANAWGTSLGPMGGTSMASRHENSVPQDMMKSLIPLAPLVGQGIMGPSSCGAVINLSDNSNHAHHFHHNDHH